MGKYDLQKKIGINGSILVSKDFSTNIGTEELGQK